KGLERAGADARLVTDAAGIEAADGVVLPGVGNFGRCSEALAASGMWDAASAAARSADRGGAPFLGICVGMQLLYSGSDEAPGTPGLGIFPGMVGLLPEGIRRPQMQWNVLETTPGSRLFAGFESGAWVYFVHSYSAPLGPETAATCQYGTQVAAAVERNNVFATQFHPEKSSSVGLGILANFVKACS
ncbi:MAG TPA: imidazole glycerol phosphate synthase subunit HisH, partial [Acidimicrobiales bacterium]|nr:imidazole glycerol phosphate synthase subunit HisH [Acidimicrobiales bacterium]